MSISARNRRSADREQTTETGTVGLYEANEEPLHLVLDEAG